MSIRLMRSFSTLAFPLSVASFVLAAPAVLSVGCGGGVASEQAASADSALTRAPVAQGAHGPLKVVGEALSEVPLSAAQRAQIEKLASDAEARHADARAARKDLMLALADQVQAGQVDRATLAPKIDALAAALGRAQPGDRASFEQLHAVLNPDQRVAFVNALQARFDAKRSEAGEKHPLKQWSDDLKLSDAQKEQIRSALRERFHEMKHATSSERDWADGGRAHHAAKMLGAFKEDRFVMDEVAPAKDVSKAAAKMADRMVGLAQTVLPILTPDQRTVAAQKIREKADHLDTAAPGMF
jgi:Spy/CpxP family protein refolding chaperone